MSMKIIIMLIKMEISYIMKMNTNIKSRKEILKFHLGTVMLRNIIWEFIPEMMRIGTHRIYL